MDLNLVYKMPFSLFLALSTLTLIKLLFAAKFALTMLKIAFPLTFVKCLKFFIEICTDSLFHTVSQLSIINLLTFRKGINSIPMKIIIFPFPEVNITNIIIENSFPASIFILSHLPNIFPIRKCDISRIRNLIDYIFILQLFSMIDILNIES